MGSSSLHPILVNSMSSSHQFKANSFSKSGHKAVTFADRENLLQKASTDRFAEHRRKEIETNQMTSADLPQAPKIKRINFRECQKGEVLGEGHFGKVELVADPHGKFYAMKSLKPQPNEDPETKQRKEKEFKGEQEIHLLLSSEGITCIPQVYEAENSPESSFLMEMLPEVSCEDLLKEVAAKKSPIEQDIIHHLISQIQAAENSHNPLSIAQLRSLVHQKGINDLSTARRLINIAMFQHIRNNPQSIFFEKACQTTFKALQQIHDAGIVHCDLKPANIMWDFTTRNPDGSYPRVMIFDFGLSKGNKNQTYDIRGTSYYFSPELVEKAIKKDHKTAYNFVEADYWALSMAFDEIATGQRIDERHNMNVQKVRELIGIIGTYYNPENPPQAPENEASIDHLIWALRFIDSQDIREKHPFLQRTIQSVLVD